MGTPPRPPFFSPGSKFFKILFTMLFCLFFFYVHPPGNACWTTSRMPPLLLPLWPPPVCGLRPPGEWLPLFWRARASHLCGLCVRRVVSSLPLGGCSPRTWAGCCFRRPAEQKITFTKQNITLCKSKANTSPTPK